LKSFHLFYAKVICRKKQEKNSFNFFLAMFGRSTASFDRLLEKATSQLLLEPDWTSIMMICDSIRQGDTNAK
jgi:hypothetical protein